MDRELLEQRKQMLTELVHDKAYVPMKAKDAFEHTKVYARGITGSIG